ncbi:phage tail sheath family protein [Spirosoma radiotolerans]|uniref:Tail sheath protein C-terminal domain-containing protein n=1 Tax=Spirosoma radiotolerans TaxID=1379870 RepID=A0A0E3V735_9BACT|nr:phage tail sheath C-terminal domain-containing protein [Spirosoma radiotolerans]AKD55547.1 hypothetical protein SD10_12210 [Spirosoma radiotolerans]
MATYRSPGVYVEEIPVFPPSVAEVETAIPAFIGYTEKAKDTLGEDLTNVAFRINGFSEFEQYYGKSPSEDPAAFSIKINEYKQGTEPIRYVIDVDKVAATISKNILHQCMKLYFANGGGPCYIVSVGKATNTITSAELIAGIDVVASEDVPTLLVVPEAVSLNGGQFMLVAEAAVKQAHDLQDRFVILDVPSTTIPKNSANIKTDVDKIRAISLDKEFRRYAAAYYPDVETSYTYNDNADFVTNKFKTIKITNHFVSVDGAAATDTGAFKGTTVDAVKTANEVLYNRIKDVFEQHHLVLPPSAAIAGIYARVDESRGVWKAPANVGLANVVKAVITISRIDQDTLNIDDVAGKSINAIINMPGYGTQVFGARTLDGNDKEWRYINVRRFVSVVEESIKKSINWAVFEPNTAPTWVRVQAMIESYLFLKWRDGALAGAKPEQAYQVQVGLNKTMTPDDVLEGLMIVEIKLAVARPAEFIVLRIMQKAQES